MEQIKHYPHSDELYEVCMCMQGMSFDVVFRQWLNEVVKNRDAYEFIRKKGLWGEFLAFKSPH